MDTVIRVVPTESSDDFDTWVAPFLPKMGLIASRFAPPSERDDVLQDALMRAWLYRDAFDPARGSTGGWLYAITANVARTRSRKARLLSLRRAPAPSTADLDSYMDLEYAIQRLPNRQRMAIQYFYAVGLTVSETAEVMNCSEGTIKSTLHDARLALKAKLKDGGDTYG